MGMPDPVHRDADALEGPHRPHSIQPIVGLAVVFAVAFAIRLVGINWALPAVIHHDERNVGLAVLKALFSGEPCPTFYYYPALAVFSHYVSAVVAFTVGKHYGLLGRLTDLRLPDYLPYARFASALAGALTVLVVAKTARDVRRGAGIPAGLVATFGFISVLHSHYATPDVSLTLFVQLALLFSFLSLSRRSPRSSFWAAAFAAFAASFKYTAFLVIIPAIVSAVLVGPKGNRMGRATQVAAVGFAIFAVINIGGIIDLPVLVDHVRAEAMHYFQAGNLGVPGVSCENPRGVMFHVRAALGDVGYVAAGLAILGIITCASSRLGRRYLLVSLAFVVPHLALFASARAAFPRNVLPLTPSVAILAGVGIARVAESVRTKSLRPKVIALVTGLAILLPARATLLNDYVMTRACSLARVQEWFIRNGEPVGGVGYRVASLHSLWTPRTVGARDLSIGEVFLERLKNQENLPDPAWFLEQGAVFFTIERWGVGRYSGLDWPDRMLGLIRHYCVLVDTISGWPPDARWFPNSGFAAPEVGPDTFFGPTVEIFILKPAFPPPQTGAG
ncbi:MAG TPA: glycosyltransferase family 39 protein [bacterium]|nr:glycosyltransferase family 39 protein [bacterium]